MAHSPGDLQVDQSHQESFHPQNLCTSSYLCQVSQAGNMMCEGWRVTAEALATSIPRHVSGEAVRNGY